MYRRWSDEDERRLLWLWPKHTVAEIARALDREPRHVIDHAAKLRKRGTDDQRKRLAPKTVVPSEPQRVIDDGYPDVPWHMRISTRDQRVGVSR